jgi:hypothetical protein
MPRLFVVEDQIHAEPLGEFKTIAEAWAELARIARIPWHESPNTAPCQSWQTCGRDYEIIEYETGSLPWVETARYAGLEIGAKGIVWGSEAPSRK